MGRRRVVLNGLKSYDLENGADVISECNFENPMNYNPLCVRGPRNNRSSGIGGGVIDLVRIEVTY